MTLDVLAVDQAAKLLARLVGPERVAAEPKTADKIVRLCGLLPLAVRIAGARLIGRPQWRLVLLAERLADERRRLFRLLGLLAVPSFAAWVAAALIDSDLAEGERLLESLVDAQLVEAAEQDQAGQLRYGG